MRKYKLLRFGRCYINREGDFVIGLLSGDKSNGYKFAGSHANPLVFLRKFQLLSRVVPNDGNWIEIDTVMFNVASALHSTGHIMTFPGDQNITGELPSISKKY